MGQKKIQNKRHRRKLNQKRKKKTERKKQTMNNVKQFPGGHGQIRIDVKELMGFESEVCDRCGHDVFVKGVYRKKLPAVHPLNNAGKEGVVNIESMFCMKCQSVVGDIIKKGKGDTGDNDSNDNADNNNKGEDGDNGKD